MRTVAARLAIFALSLAIPLVAMSSDPQAPELQGDFVGKLGTLPVLLHLARAADGTLIGSLDSPSQGATGIPCSDFRVEGKKLAFRVPAVKGSWEGSIEEGGAKLAGTWTQGPPQPLTFTRGTLQSLYAPALAPVSAAEMQATLGRDLESALERGTLAAGTGVGVAIGVVRDGERRVFAFGQARPDAIFEIGSVTKTFTGLLLAQLIAQGKVKAEEPVRELLPAGTVQKPAGAEISLLDLVTQHSGLPRMPDNLDPANPANPYADYGATKLYEFMARQGVERAEAPRHLYSNLGFGLLGQALANRASVDYAQLVKQLVTDPLCMDETFMTPSAEQQARFAAGRRFDASPASNWDFDALAGAGGLRSTAADMLKYLEAQLHPEQSCGASRPEAPGAGTLAAAVTQTHELRSDAGPGMRIGYAWVFDPRSGIYWHNGATGGYSSFAFFHPEKDYAAVVLANRSIGPDGSLADALGRHIERRLAGEPALAIE
jgi:serine-type D-Ala-D-Ala carboxypeptidase/endopeptidase